MRELAEDAYKLFLKNPLHPSFRNHPLGDVNRGRHQPGSRSISITMQYRALYVIEGDTNVWYWIGSHNDYENLTGRK
ncbi:ParE family toxin-like protein [Planctomicrobium piriforme]